MKGSALRNISSLELEEQILNGGSLIAVIATFLPWMGGEWLGGETVTYSGLGFYTAFIGAFALILHLFVLSITAAPLLGGFVVIRKRHRDVVRLIATSLASLMMLAALTVLTRVTFEFSRMEIRFGVYVAIVSSLVATLYAFLRYQEHRRGLVQELFHHPEDNRATPECREPITPTPPPPPPPPPSTPEQHRIHHSSY
ncbi:hypothetical protein FJZ27_02335 [Candidatus Peribacteria bacterium]|nr:hypothetical protein [Candidatus Peribacteria bacterium]